MKRISIPILRAKNMEHKDSFYYVRNFLTFVEDKV